MSLCLLMNELVVLAMCETDVLSELYVDICCNLDVLRCGW